MKFSKLKIQPILKFLMISTLMFSHCTCDKSTEPGETQSNLMIVYPNSGPKITLVDYNSYEIVKEITVDIPDTLQIHRMCLSSNNDYFIFIAMTNQPPFNSYLITYDISNDTIENIFPTGLDSVGAPRLSAAYIPEEPGLIYLYTHSIGLFSIDIFSREVNLISDERGQSLGKYFYFTQDKKTIGILELHHGYSEVEFYHASSRLTNVNFTLNKNNQDSIEIDDLRLSADDQTMFISIRLPEMRYIANYFGSYDLQTKKLYKSSLTFPWSLNPYILAFSPKRDECYMSGASDSLYIIGTDSSDYYIKDIIIIPGKVSGESKILIKPDENILFVSDGFADKIFVIDLEIRQVINTISIQTAFLMLLL
jgi:hypothetical protein